MIDIQVTIDDGSGWPAEHPWETLAIAAARAAIAGSAFAALADAVDPIEIAIRFADDDAVHALNREWRGKDKATNVLSFQMADPADLRAIADDPAGGDADGPELMLGDIVLASGVCAREAADKGATVDDHARHLVVHGTLHLLGYDHLDDAEAEAMEALERRILATLGVDDPYRAED